MMERIRFYHTFTEVTVEAVQLRKWDSRERNCWDHESSYGYYHPCPGLYGLSM